MNCEASLNPLIGNSTPLRLLWPNLTTSSLPSTQNIQLPLSHYWSVNSIRHDWPSNLYHRLEHAVGITSRSSGWFESYMSERIHHVRKGDSMFNGKQLQCGEPQTSVLLPMLCCILTSPHYKIVRRRKLLYLCYAGKSQMYVIHQPWEQVHCTLEACHSDVANWIRSNKLKLYPDKIEPMLFSYISQTKIPCFAHMQDRQNVANPVTF